MATALHHHRILLEPRPTKLRNAEEASAATPPENRNNNKKKKKGPSIPRAIPALYATPESTPLPDSPSSFPPSPYIVNHKRRGPRLLLKSFSQNDVASAVAATNSSSAKGSDPLPPLPPSPVVERPEAVASPAVVEAETVEEVGVAVANGFADGKAADEENTAPLVSLEVEGGDDFFDPQESMSVASSVEVEDGSGPEQAMKTGVPSTPIGEYYDAFEEIAIEGATTSSVQNIEAELREMRLNLLMEIEGRKQAEEGLCNLQNQWQSLSHQLSLVGLTLPALPPITKDGIAGSGINPAEELQQQVILARFVAGSIGRGCTRAEVELEMESHIESKNFEIARLWDRLHYYESANREMSQRNQEAVERARQHRHKRKRRQKWVWSTMGLAIAIGAAAVALSYLPVSSTSHPAETNSVDSHEVN